METNIRYTIIIPHKNCPELLRRCVDSIPKRDDIQIIVVDDNSDVDNKPSLDRSDVNVILLDAEHSKGAGKARNVGLEQAKGKWLLFADADDFFNDNLSNFIDDYFQSDADLIVFDTNSVLSDTLEPVDNRENIVSIYKKGNDENTLRYCHHSVWGKMFRLQIVRKHNMRFQEVAASNDAFFAACAGVYAKKVIFCPMVVYCCTVRRGSICTGLTMDNVKARIYVVETVNRFLKKNGVSSKYWMNRLGPLFNLKKLSSKEFFMSFIKYFWGTNPLRIYFDFKESGGRFLARLNGNVNDKDIKMMQKQAV